MHNCLFSSRAPRKQNHTQYLKSYLWHSSPSPLIIRPALSCTLQWDDVTFLPLRSFWMWRLCLYESLNGRKMLTVGCNALHPGRLDHCITLIWLHRMRKIWGFIQDDICKGNYYGRLNLGIFSFSCLVHSGKCVGTKKKEMQSVCPPRATAHKRQ